MKTLLGILFFITTIMSYKYYVLYNKVKVKAVVKEIYAQKAYTRDRMGIGYKNYGEMKDHPVFCFNYKGAIYKTAEFDPKYKAGVEFENTYKVGDSVMVYFPSDKPLQAKPYGLFTYWLNIGTLILIFIFSLVWIGAVYLFKMPNELNQ
jgi:hypothetical protein